MKISVVLYSFGWGRECCITTTSMKTTTIHLARNSDGSLWCSCDLEIPGVGKITMRDLVSEETFVNLSREIEANARVKMGMKYEDKPPAA